MVLVDINPEATVRDIGIVFGAVLTSNGMTAYVPEVQAYWLVLAGLAITKVAMSWKKGRNSL